MQQQASGSDSKHYRPNALRARHLRTTVYRRAGEHRQSVLSVSAQSCLVLRNSVEA